jgi:hypothetical protein
MTIAMTETKTTNCEGRRNVKVLQVHTSTRALATPLVVY